jgi:hypothetical protein
MAANYVIMAAKIFVLKTFNNKKPRIALGDTGRQKKY